MSDSTGEWIVLGPSALQRRLHVFAALVCAALAVALLAKAFVARTPTLLWVAAALNGAGGVWVLRARQTLGLAYSAVRIDGDGAIRLQDRLQELPVVCVPLFVSTWMVVLKTPKSMAVLWCDAMSPDGFRQLVVAARWPDLHEPTELVPALPVTTRSATPE